MSIVKIMPCLDMKDGRVVKGVHFVDLKDAGDPVENAAYYQKEGADELAILDIAATLENRKTRLEWVRGDRHTPHRGRRYFHFARHRNGS
jgi:cyclase